MQVLRLACAIGALILFGVTAARAQDCEKLDPRQVVSENLTKDIRGSARTLFKVGQGEGEYKSTASKEVRNLYDRYPQADKIVLKDKLIFLFCEILKSSSLAPAKKLEELQKFMVTIQEVGSSPATTPSQPPKGRPGVTPPGAGVGSTTKEYRWYRFELGQCGASGASVSCEFFVTSVGRDGRVVLVVQGNQPTDTCRSRGFDANGHQFNASTVALGRRSNQPSGQVEIDVVADVRTAGRLTFRDVGARAGGWSRLDLCGFAPDAFRVEFRSVPIQD